MQNNDCSSNMIFLRNEIPYKPTENVTHLKVQNQIMLSVVDNKQVECVSLKNFSKTIVNLPINEEDSIAHIHLDYSGIHSLITTINGDNFYLNLKLFKLTLLKRLKTHIITSIAWNFDFVHDNGTGFIILGTSKGSIIETNISNTNTSNPVLSHFKNWENILTPDLKLSIINLYFFQCSDDEDQYILLICMPGRLYALRESVNFDPKTLLTASAFLHRFFNFNKSQFPRYHSYKLEENSVLFSGKFTVYPLALNEIPNQFCWGTSEGISIGYIDLNAKLLNDSEKISILDKTSVVDNNNKSSDNYEIIIEKALIKYKQFNNCLEIPIDICLTEFHLLVLYKKRLVAYSLLNQSIAFEENFLNENVSYLVMTRDESSQLIWLLSTNSISNYRPFDETRYIWRYYLEKKDFGKARKLTKILKDPAPYQLVIRRESEKFIAEKNYVAAAEILIESTSSFESIVLQFLKSGAEGRNGLKRFLELKLNQLQEASDAIKRDILVIWLLEIQLSELAELKLSNRYQKFKLNINQTNNLLNEEDKLNLLKQETELKKLREQLYCFLNRKIVNDSISANHTVVYRIVLSHVDFETQFYIANKLKDYNIIFKVLLLRRQFKDALNLLKNHPNPIFYYTYAPEIFPEIPEEIVESLINNKKILKVNELLSIFSKCFEEENKSETNSKMVEATFYYFDNALKKKEGYISYNFLGIDENVINFVINFYATFKPNLLFDFLKNGNFHHYEDNYALDICLNKKLYNCCVFIYCQLHLFDNAMKLALEIDIELACDVAIRMNEDFPFIKIKQPWLEILQHLIKKNESVDECMKLIQKSNDRLNIQDLISYSHEFTSIKQLKEPLCEYLKKHSKKIQSLQKEIKVASQMVNKIHGDLEKTNAKFMVVKTSDKCTLCKDSLLLKPFTAYICRHFIHINCLENYLNQKKLSQKGDDDDCPLCGFRITDQFSRSEIDTELKVKWFW